MLRWLLIVGAINAICLPVVGQNSFVNWENPHIHPLDITPGSERLLVVNTADNRLEIFNIVSGTGSLAPAGAVPVGLEPVSVRARSDEQAWVVNHVSDSVSVVSLTTLNVVATLKTADEPCDVVFAGAPPRAFVTCSQANCVQVFDPLDLAAAPITIAITGEDPRAMAVSPDGAKVYAAIFESGNGTTILGGGATTKNFFPPNVVSDPSGPYGGQNPPPNSNEPGGFDPPMNPANPPPPPVGLIVRKSGDGAWIDDHGGDWTEFVSGSSANLSGRPVGWDLWDHDVAEIDAQTLTVSYHTRLMNLCMALAVNPSTGQVTVVGTEALNEVRFEPTLNGRFLRTQIALLDGSGGDSAQVFDLNPHLDYLASNVPPALRAMSIGDPRGVAWSPDGDAGYITGMGSNNLIVVDAAGQRDQAEPIEVGQGPTGVVVDQAGSRIYVLNKFEATISVIDAAKRVEVQRVWFFDPTPAPIKLGRPHLYDGHKTSGLGHISCTSCHPDGRMDRLAWDLGNPSGEMIGFDQNCNFGAAALGSDPCLDWHPMKGPMVTQTLQDIIGKEPHHWRGDRDGIEEFNQTFVNLQGADAELTAGQMQELEDFLATIALPPNPFRNLNNTLPTSLPLPGQYYAGVGGAPGTPLPNGNASAGFGDFTNHHLVEGFSVQCSTCHTTPTGVGTNLYFPPGGGLTPFPSGSNGELHHTVVFSELSETPSMSVKVVQLRNLHEKVGFEMTQQRSLAGFGFLHDGSVDSLARFMGNPPFVGFGLQIDGPPSVKVPRMVAFMMAFSGSDLNPNATTPGGPQSRDAHAAVGRQVTFHASSADPALVAQLNELMAIADTPPDSAPGPRISVVAKGLQQNMPRGYAYAGNGLFQSDRLNEALSASALISAAGVGAEITFSAVPLGTQTRIGVDRDEDGYFDRDELDVCSDPANAKVTPENVCAADIAPVSAPDGTVNVDDLLAIITGWGLAGVPGSVTGDIAPNCGDGIVNVDDLLAVINAWGPCN